MKKIKKKKIRKAISRRAKALDNARVRDAGKTIFVRAGIIK
ncbi:TPA: DUF3983 domain-containing protein [Bacillus cereus]|nr:DUF3983 domain-containing protein [Bacillus cereus]